MGQSGEMATERSVLTRRVRRMRVTNKAGVETDTLVSESTAVSGTRGGEYVFVCRHIWMIANVSLAAEGVSLAAEGVRAAKNNTNRN